MGTTIVVGVQSEEALEIAHVGDSRAYLLRDGKPVLLTNDHSVVQEMVRAGRLTEEQYPNQSLQEFNHALSRTRRARRN